VGAVQAQLAREDPGLKEEVADMAKNDGWWEQRLGLGSSLRAVLDEQIPGGAKFTYALGSATLLTFLTLVATGIFELFFYVPSTASAYNSVNYLRFQVPFGWLVHGLHYWAANAMIVLVGLHLAQTFIWGAFKKPRELTWVFGVLLLLATMGAVFTGGPLAWDEQGYWAANVGAQLAGTIPGIGGWLEGLVFGPQPLGQLSLSRLFPLHIAVMPILIICIFGLHMVAFRKGGAAGSVKDGPRIGEFWPDQIVMDLLLYSGILTTLVWLSATYMTPITGPADGIDPTYVARPDWPFLWLFQLLKYVGGQIEWVPFVLVPLLSVALLLAVPWLDRKADRSPTRRPIAMLVFAVVVAAVSALTYFATTDRPPAIAAPAGVPPATPASALDTTPSPAPSIASYTIGSADHGRLIFIAYCQQCHGIDGKNGIVNPNSADGEVPAINPIDAEISGADNKGHIADVQKFVDGIDQYLQNGSAPESDPEGTDPKYKMPSFGNTFAMTQPQIADVEAYLLQLNGAPRATIAHPGVDPKTYAWWVLGGFVLVVVFGLIALMGVRRRGSV
jgi:ubiquinol-cytochrome c reductase cytochrome b subunit